MYRNSKSVGAWCALLGLLVSAASQATQVDVVDRVTGAVLPIYYHEGRAYVAGEPGNEYEIRIHSVAGQRMLAVTSIDGVNVITGQTASTGQSGYVLDPYGFVRIEGWRKSLSRTAAFYFTKLPDSYAARTGRPDNVGVIGIALFSEQTPCCLSEQESRNQDSSSAPAASAKESGMAAPRADRRREEKLGTGHGRSEYSAASYTQFERSSEFPQETVTIYYDSRRNLLAQGIIPQTRYADRTPQPFPGGFTPDP